MQRSVDLCFIMDHKFPLALSYDDVLLVPQHSRIESRKDVDLSILLSPRVKLKLPLISTLMSDVTGYEMAVRIAELGGIGFIHRFNTSDEQASLVSKVKSKDLLVGAAVGCRDNHFEREEKLIHAGADLLILDVTHGHMQKAIDRTRQLKVKFGKQVDIHSGLVATYDGANRLFKAGADCVHVGIGGGSICTTRIEAGIGVPNITTILETKIAAINYKKTIVVDAGIKRAGDIVKALGAGAHAVRCGNIFAGHDESPGKLINIKNKKFKHYKGSTSLKEKNSHIKKGVVKDDNYTEHIEGVESFVPYKGPLENTIKRLEAGLRAGFSYCGAKNIKELQKKAKFVRITDAGMRESAAHDVVVIKD